MSKENSLTSYDNMLELFYLSHGGVHIIISMPKLVVYFNNLSMEKKSILFQYDSKAVVLFKQIFG